MLISNYDLNDIYSVLIVLRAKPNKEDNAQIIRSVLQVLSEPQTDSSIGENIIRKQLRSIPTLDREYFRWAYADNIYTDGVKVIEDDFCYSFLKNGLSKMLECAVNRDYDRLEALADALHNIPIYFAEGCKNFKKAVKIQFALYDRTYKTNLLKELSN